MGIHSLPPLLFFFYTLSGSTMPLIINLAATTELEAVNAMLSAIGEAPVDTVDTAQTDVAMAVAILRDTTRELQNRRWRFNTEYGYEMTPSGVDGIYNVFEVPTDLLSFTLSRVSGQEGQDAVLRRSRTYTKSGAKVLILADRLHARDGWTLSTLTIDPVWLYGFEECPEAARRYIVIAASRRFAQQAVGSDELSKFSQADEDMALQVLQQENAEQAPVVPTGTPLTEVDALNQMLAAAGKEPVYAVTALSSPDAVAALNELRAVSREVQAQGWRFNSEFGFEVLPSGTLDVTHSNGYTATLNIFEAPEDLLSFETTNSPDQQGIYYVDTEIRPSRKYTVDGAPVRVFYDRTLNRDGFERTALYIDPVWLLSFDALPDSARRYITLRSTRIFLQSYPALLNTSRLIAADETEAYREFKREQGDHDDYNIFGNAGVSRFLGGRPFGISGVTDWRATPGVQ